MKKFLATVSVVSCASLWTAQALALDLDTDKKRFSYIVGIQVGQQIRGDNSVQQVREILKALGMAENAQDEVAAVAAMQGEAAAALRASTENTKIKLQDIAETEAIVMQQGTLLKQQEAIELQKLTTNATSAYSSRIAEITAGMPQLFAARQAALVAYNDPSPGAKFRRALGMDSAVDDFWKLEDTITANQAEITKLQGLINNEAANVKTLGLTITNEAVGQKLAEASLVTMKDTALTPLKLLQEESVAINAQVNSAKTAAQALAAKATQEIQKFIDLDEAAFMAAIKDTITGAKLKINPADIQATLARIQKQR